MPQQFDPSEKSEFKVGDRVVVVQSDTVYANMDFYGKGGEIKELLNSSLGEVYRVSFSGREETGLYIESEIKFSEKRTS